jgi:hypothetical protein
MTNLNSTSMPPNSITVSEILNALKCLRRQKKFFIDLANARLLCQILSDPNVVVQHAIQHPHCLELNESYLRSSLELNEMCDFQTSAFKPILDTRMTKSSAFEPILDTSMTKSSAFKPILDTRMTKSSAFEPILDTSMTKSSAFKPIQDKIRQSNDTSVSLDEKTKSIEYYMTLQRYESYLKPILGD